MIRIGDLDEFGRRVAERQAAFGFTEEYVRAQRKSDELRTESKRQLLAGIRANARNMGFEW